MDCLCDVASVIVCVCVGRGEGVRQTDLVMKDLEIASHHGGSGYKGSSNTIKSRGE